MNTASQKSFNKIFGALSALIFVLLCIRAFIIPLSHEEVAAFFFYIQSDDYWPYTAHLSTGNHFLNSVLANLFYHIFGAQPFALRLPSLLAFPALAYGIYRHFRFLSQLSSKIALTACFLFMAPFLDLFSVSSGFGLSVAFMLLALSYLTEYFYDKNRRSIVLFSVCIQVALCANLMLFVITGILLIYLYVRQYRIRTLFLLKNIVLQIINLGLLAFWGNLLLFYREKGVFGAATANEYWDLTFKSLIDAVTGSKQLWVLIVVLLIAAPVLVYFFWNILKNSFWFNDLFKPLLAYPFMFVILVCGFYAQKKILGMNYPEDRSGLAFFVLIVLSLAFFIDSLPATFANALGAVVSALSIVAFVVLFRFSTFSTWFYQTIPPSLYQTLADEAAKDKEPVTIGGSPIREYNFAFLNYKNEGRLNPMNDQQEMQMNCDYYIAAEYEKPFYEAYYTELARDDKWGRILLKRKKNLEHKTFFERGAPQDFSGSKEFFDIKALKDTVFASRNPLEAEIEISFEKVPTPFNAFLAMSIENEKGEVIHYRRIALNWLAKDLNGQQKDLKITSGNLPAKIGRLVLHLWNIDRKEVQFTVKGLKLYQLFGKGADVKIPASYYKMVEQISQKPLL
jgi:hypothetical protein